MKSILYAFIMLSLSVFIIFDAAADSGVKYEYQTDNRGLLLSRMVTPGFAAQPAEIPPILSPAPDQEVIFTVDDAAAIARDVAICGVQRDFLTGWYLNNKRTTKYPVEGTGAFTWEYWMDSNFYIPVACSDDGTVMVSTGDITALNVWLSGAGPAPSWQYTYPIGYQAKEVDVSDNGTYILSAAKHESLDDGKLFVFNADSSAPIWEVDYNAEAGIYGLEISEDNNWIIVSTYHNFYIYNLPNRVLFQTIGGYGQIKAGIDDDAEWLAIGDFHGIVTVYRRVGNSYAQQWTNYMGGWITALDIAQNASVVLAGNMLFNPYSGVARAMTITGDTLWTYNQYGDYVASVSLSNDGSVGVAGSWGQLDYTFGDVFTAFDIPTGDVIFRLLDDIDEPGTIFCTSISDDGAFAVCGGKMVHARTFGRGGQVYSIRLRTPAALTVTMTPQNPPVQIPAGGGSFNFTAEVNNQTTNPITFDAWIEAVLPNGNVYGPIILRQGLVIGAGGSISRLLNQVAPGSAPPGNYQYVGNAGVYPDSVAASDSFPLVKMPGADGGNRFSGWELYGWDDAAELAPVEYGSLTASPNPFNPETVIDFSLPYSARIELTVFNALGEKVAVLVEGYYPEGSHSAVFNASNLPSGIYFCRLQAKGISKVRKLMLLK